MGKAADVLRTLGVAVLGGVTATVIGAFLPKKEGAEAKVKLEQLERKGQETQPVPGERPRIIRRPIYPAATDPGPSDLAAEKQEAEDEVLADLRSAQEVALDAHANHLIRHNLEQVDRRWAGGMERRLTALLSPKMTEREGMQSMRVDCRSETCVATSKWTSKALLRATFAALRDDTLGSPCLVSATLPEGEEADSAELSMFFDCSEDTSPSPGNELPP